jgi:hypothetical protein
MRQFRMMAVLVALAVVSSGCVYLAQVSVDPNGVAYTVATDLADVSGDGRYVVISSADPLLAADTNTQSDIYRKDTSTGALELVTVEPGGSAAGGSFSDAAVSDDGRFIVFASAASTIIVGDTNSSADVFLRDMISQTTTRVSLDDNDAEVAAGSFEPDISGDGTVVTWRSTGAFAGGQSNGFQQVYRSALPSGTTTIVSASAAGALGNDSSLSPSIDATGSAIAFSSGATNLVAGDTNGADDIFVRFVSGAPVRASTAQGGGQANGDSSYPSIAGNASSVAFDSAATNLISGDTNGVIDVYVKSLTGAIERASVTGSGGELTGVSQFSKMNGDGTAVVFNSRAFELNAGFGLNVAHVRDLDQGSTTRASVSSTGDIVHLGPSPVAGISADGNYVAFAARETLGAVVPGDANGVEDVFLRWWSEPEVLSVTPSTLTLGIIQSVTINGTGFRGGGAVTDLYTNRFGADGITFANIVVVDDTTITADVETIMGVTTTGPKVLWLENPGTGPGSTNGALVNCACLSVSL